MTDYNKELTENIYTGYHFNATGNDNGLQPLGEQPETAATIVSIQRYPKRTGKVKEGTVTDSDGNIVERWSDHVINGSYTP